jgi:hypothetical protein
MIVKELRQQKKLAELDAYWQWPIFTMKFWSASKCLKQLKILQMNS